MNHKALGGGGALTLCALLLACSGESTQLTGSGASAGAAGSGVAGAGGNGASAGNGNGAAAGNGSAGIGAGVAGSAGAAGAGSCMPIVACGGNLVGTWLITSYCSNPISSTSPASCPSGSIDISAPSIAGTLTFNANNTFSTNATIGFTETAQIPASCSSQSQCTQLGATLGSSTGVTSSSCAFDAVTGCSCSLQFSQSTMTSGTYQLSGGSVVITTTMTSTGTTNGPETDAYCVSGNTLTVQGVDSKGQISVFTASKQ